MSKHRGRVFKTTGGGVLIEFSSAVSAVQCAVDLQQAMEAANNGQSEDRRIVLRIGVNLGGVLVEGSDLYGDGVNIAARLQQLAEPGDICVCSKVANEVERKFAVAFEAMGEQRVRNIAEPLAVYRVLAEGTETQRLPSRRPPLMSRGRTAMAVASLLLIVAAGVGASIWSTGQPPTAGGVPSLAVLPFANMSGDAAQDHLGPGVAEEIIIVLSSYPGLRVVSPFVELHL